MLRWVQLDSMADRSPRALSGGQQQRVALARAMAIEPDVLLLDEPFSALDAKLRAQMRKEIRDLQQDAGITSVFVTHDQEEAMAIADRIGVMNHGRLEQLGSAHDLYKRPASRFVASFIGKCNLLEGQVVGEGRFESSTGMSMRFTGTRPPGPAALCFRPEHATLGAQPSPETNSLPVTVRSVTYLGPLTEFEGVTDKGEILLIAAASGDTGATPAAGQRLNLNWLPADSFVVE
jgi:putative spermidine/putrescine transport system ATP-binding protein